MSRRFVANLLVTEDEVSSMLKQVATKDDPVELRKASSGFFCALWNWKLSKFRTSLKLWIKVKKYFICVIT